MFRVKMVATIGLSLLTAMLVAAPPALAEKHEQVVFSGEADGSLGEIGFWVWCAVDEAGNYDDCAGAIEFDDHKLVKHVEGEVAEIDDEVYQMDVASRDGAIACVLTNTPSITHGLTNMVDVVCSSPSATASTSSVVVVSTG
jgi:hypothetical protein